MCEAVEVIGWDIDPPADGPHEQRLRDQRFVDRGMTTKPVADRETPSDDTQANRLGWHMPDNLRWLAEQSERPNYLPCGMLTGEFLKLCAEKWEGQIEATRALSAQVEELREGLERAKQLFDCVEQTANNVWWVNADDPETAVCDTYGEIEALLAKHKETGA